MSPEEAQREMNRRREQEVTQDLEQSLKPARTSQNRSRHDIPPMPDHQPPAPPPGPRSPEGRETVEKANDQAIRSEEHGASENQVPDRVLRATLATQDRQDSLPHDHILPVVQEAGESHDNRQRAPAKNKTLPPTRAPPPIPPKSANTASNDSGYAGNTNGISMDQPKLSRESLRNKTLPPLPKHSETEDSGVQMVA